MANAWKKVVKIHAFKAIKSNQKWCTQDLKFSGKVWKRILNCYMPNAAFCMHVKHPFIDKINWRRRNWALATEFRRSKKRMGPLVERNQEIKRQWLGKSKSMRIFARIWARDSSFVRKTSFQFCPSYFLDYKCCSTYNNPS